VDTNEAEDAVIQKV
jgi:hypothetical protein